MIIAIIVLSVLLAFSIGINLWHVGNSEETKQELLDAYWSEFLDWVMDAREIKSVQEPYDFWKEIKDGHTRYVPMANDHNFWQWYLDYKWVKER